MTVSQKSSEKRLFTINIFSFLLTDILFSTNQQDILLFHKHLVITLTAVMGFARGKVEHLITYPTMTQRDVLYLGFCS